MNAMSKLYSLFVKHLRTLYNGEKVMAAALHSFCNVSSSEGMRNLFCRKAEEKDRVLNIHREIFHQLHANAEGETDPVILSLLKGDEEASNPQSASLSIAVKLYGDEMHSYHINAYKSAISCAEDLGMFDIAELLQDCLRSTSYNKVDFELLNEEIEKATNTSSHTEVA